MVEAAAAELFGDVGGVEAKLGNLAPDLAADLVRHLARALDLGLERVQLALDEAAHGVDHHLLFLTEAEVHGSQPSRRSCQALSTAPAA